MSAPLLHLGQVRPTGEEGGVVRAADLGEGFCFFWGAGAGADVEKSNSTLPSALSLSAASKVFLVRLDLKPFTFGVKPFLRRFWTEMV